MNRNVCSAFCLSFWDEKLHKNRLGVCIILLNSVKDSALLGSDSGWFNVNATNGQTVLGFILIMFVLFTSFNFSKHSTCCEVAHSFLILAQVLLKTILNGNL